MVPRPFVKISLDIAVRYFISIDVFNTYNQLTLSKIMVDDVDEPHPIS